MRIGKMFEIGQRVFGGGMEPVRYAKLKNQFLI